jgi:hypothetical protein
MITREELEELSRLAKAATEFDERLHMQLLNISRLHIYCTPDRIQRLVEEVQFLRKALERVKQEATL